MPVDEGTEIRQSVRFSDLNLEKPHQILEERWRP